MSYKLGTYFALSLILLLGIGYFISLNTSSSPVISTSSIGPSYFPNILFSILIILCFISFFQTAKKEDKNLNIPNTKFILFTVVLTMLFIGSWHVFDLFYISTFIFLSILFTVYRLGGNLKKNLLTSASIALAVTVFIYIFFEKVMVIPL